MANIDNVNKDKACPCGSGMTFLLCCQPFLTGAKYPVNAEQLMRSRFSAYSESHAQYIFDTYTQESQQTNSVSDIEEWAKENIWLRLTVHQHNPVAQPAQVEFSAFYLHQERVYEMRECSNFIKENEQWRYHDGEIIKHEQIATIKRNDPCPCLSGKKYKKCCAR
ncbi:YchJ family protein [Thalassotalea euphylliae]|nr:YchJ family protein [Thalassotalea euphylliae]